jgi:predicted HTH transcriptional regulator
MRKPVDSNTLENLLNEDESNYIDFKQAQYRFAEASEEDKSEILKDILAFANAWRRTDAYILIGVKEIKGGRSQVIGITDHSDDAALQQFVNSKVQKPIQFSYIAFEFEEKQVGIVKIPVQERPFYLKQKYGKLKPNVVYLRRGSSTDEAEPDEIAKMGIALASSTQSQIPNVDCEFANPITRTLYGKEIELSSTVLIVNEPIQNFSPRQTNFAIASIGSSPNRNFYRELFHIYEYQSLLCLHSCK